MPVLQANRKKKFLTSKVVLANHKKLGPAKHTQNRQSQNLTSAKLVSQPVYLKCNKPF